MGSDDLFRKRKARDGAALQRQRHERAQNKRYLVVCEGTKTEPHYFRELLVDLCVRPQIVRIAPNNGVSPDRVVSHALALYVDDATSGDPYDMVYCVFDRDRHSTFDAAVKRIKDLNAAAKPLVAITSTPCFEVWLLLHFGFTDQPFHPAGNKAVGEQVTTALKTKPGFEKYGKGQKGIYALLQGKLNDALDNADQLRRQSEVTGSINPSTDVDKLVLMLKKLGQ